MNNRLLILICLLMLFGCKSKNDMQKNPHNNPNYPDVDIDVTINPNSTQYQELNTVGGWMYLTAQQPSRGLIVYHKNYDDFMAYDRIPPNTPNACCNDYGNYTRLVVDFPFVVDTCLNVRYSILDGSIFDGEGYPLIEYFTEYDGITLRIYN